MQHNFDVDIAKEYGVLEAILLNNIWFWIEKNKANKTNYYDGYYWTYNSTKAFGELFPYVSTRQISNALKKLQTEEVLKTGNYNKVAYDRTLWYAFTKKGECIMQKCKMDYANLSNGLVENVEPIPDNKPDNKPNNNKESKKESKKDTTYDEIINQYVQDEKLTKSIYDFIKMRKMIKKPLTNRGLELLIQKLYKMTNNIDTMILILDQSILGNWQGIYPLKENQQEKQTGNPFFDLLREEGKM